jgi:hypothetical protein
MNHSLAKECILRYVKDDPASYRRVADINGPFSITACMGGSSYCIATFIA